jgi:hypothetical protein
MVRAVFKVGDTVRYLGKREVTVSKEGQGDTPLIFQGMTAKITKVVAPDKGLGLVRMKSGDLVLDDDQDGYNVYTNEWGNTAIIWPRDKEQWERINEK